jgi:hypothetical protein
VAQSPGGKRRGVTRSGGWRWRWPAAAAAAALALVIGCSTDRPDESGLELGRPGRVVPPQFVGYSIEYRTLGGFLGLSRQPANPLLAEAWATTGDAITVRVGGNSADRSWPAGWPRRPPTVRYEITAAWWRRLAAALRAAGARAEPTLNLAARRPDAGAELLRRAVAALPPGVLGDVQIGNEPDLYDKTRWQVAGGAPTGLRPAGYRFEDFVAEQRDVLAALQRTGLPFSLTGPGFASPAWRQRASGYLAAGLPIRRYASHVYPLSNCRDNGAGVRADDLLLASTTARAVRALQPELTAAGAARVPLVVQEGNSMACRGKAGVSDHPYSALWAADQLFALLQAGVGGYFFHVSDSSYDPYAFRWTGSEWQVRLAPVYAGLLLFQHAAVPGARLLPVTGAPDGVAAWATRDPRGTLRVLALNRATDRPARVTVPGSRARALTLTTEGGLRLGGTPWPRWRDTARIDLSRFEQRLEGSEDRLSVSLPAASAVVLTVTQ